MREAQYVRAVRSPRLFAWLSVLLALGCGGASGGASGGGSVGAVFGRDPDSRALYVRDVPAGLAAEIVHRDA